MEYILINEGKLKVMLEHEDLTRWDISADELDYGNPHAKFVFDDILQYAKDTFGFDTSGHKVLLQLYPSRDGGCELFITRLPSLSDKSELPEAPSKIGTSAAYSFEKLTYLLFVCKRLRAIGFDGDSSALTDRQGASYLLLGNSEMILQNELHVPNGLSFIEEFGEARSPRSLSLYLLEYATPICEGNAVETLGKI